MFKKSLLRFLASIFGAITRLRNYCYDAGIFTSTRFDHPFTLVVGNLSLGGTGKSPFVHYLASHWKFSGKLGLLSRGYGRKTNGFRWVTPESTALEVGDEPLAYKKQFVDLPVAVCEKRVRGIEQMADLQTVILDDAFQHRALRGDLNMICTTFLKPFFSDQIMPLGRLRESIDGLKRAQAIIVNRCPAGLTAEQRAPFLTYGLPVFFTQVVYANPVGPKLHEMKRWHLFAGIADPWPFFKYAKSLGQIINQDTYPDHYLFKEADYQFWEKLASELNHDTGILTTHKDFVRMEEHLETYPNLKSRLYYLPMQMEFIDQETDFWDWMATQIPLTLKK
jgi:tetraacyldisaccharide 4'-kinase